MTTNAQDKKVCRHRWRIGSWIGGWKDKKVVRTGINIWCWKCNKKIKAYDKGIK